MLFLIIVFYSQGVLYPYDTIISQAAAFILLMISLIYFLFFSRIISRPPPFFVKLWTAILIINIIYFAFEGSTLYLQSIISGLLNLLPFYAFYIFAEKGYLKSKHLQTLFFVLLFLFSYRFVNSNIELQVLRGRENVVDNTIYLFIGLLPFVFIIKKRFLSIVSIATIWFFMIQSAKRGAIVTGFITIILFYYYLFMSFKKEKYIFLKYSAAFIIIIGISYWAYDFYTQNEYVVQRITTMLEGDSSGRDRLSLEIFENWYNSDNPFVYLFGKGYQSSFKITSHASHNEWLDVLVSFGLFGFSVYFAMFFSGFRFILKENWIFYKKISFICLLLCALIASITSRWIMSSFPYSQMLLLPYLLVTYDNDK